MSKSTQSMSLQNIHRTIVGVFAAVSIVAIASVSPLMKNEEGARQKLDDEHYTEINITGGKWCGHPYHRNTTFEAINEKGELKTGYVSQSLINPDAQIIKLDR